MSDEEVTARLRNLGPVPAPHLPFVQSRHTAVDAAAAHTPDRVIAGELLTRDELKKGVPSGRPFRLHVVRRPDGRENQIDENEPPTTVTNQPNAILRAGACRHRPQAPDEW